MSEKIYAGTSEGETCGRSITDGIFCKGTIEDYHEGDGCSCHIHPPCSYCVSGRLICSQCGWEEGI